ncbi:Bug family tripartite tricarboxylate transporter substrate binding protein [Demetria terragena]|uniref:Bug family tripartite tricarboxylate transporter substrate binding protein n=1 Tax=Demetria terragena TaxID=63959 RepID=UPI0005916180|nr:tripartite tricarboxylate transporter substrate-binding protein [Demetria terragena]
MSSTRHDAGPRRKWSVGMAVYAVVVVIVVGLAVSQSFIRAGASTTIRDKATFIAPAGAGGGWDTFMREAQAAARDHGLASTIQVRNVPGANGTIGLRQLNSLKGRPDVAMVGGSGIVAGEIEGNTSIHLTDMTPIARVVEEYDVVLVPASSPYKTLKDLIAAWKKNPKAVPFTGGGSFDELVMAQLAKAAGIDPKKVAYIPKSGGGEVAQALVTKTAAAALSGYPDVVDQIASGRLRALGIAAKEPLQGVKIPTLRSMGYDVTLANWRAVFAPPGISADEAGEIRDVFKSVTKTPEWSDAVKNYKWNPVWLEGPAFEKFLRNEYKVIGGLYEDLGK